MVPIPANIMTLKITTMRRNNQLWPLLAIMLLALISCDTKLPKSTSTRGIAKIMCDESFQSILEQEIAVFEYQ